MSKRKKIVRWSLLITLGLIITLAVHIYVTTNPEPAPTDAMRLARIDFSEKPDSTSAYTIQGLVERQNGIHKAYFNIKDGIFVYAYYPAVQSPDKIYQMVTSSFPFRATAFKLPPGMESRGCPVMSRSEVTRRLAVYIARHF